MDPKEEVVSLFDDVKPVDEPSKAVEDEVVANATPAFEVPKKFEGKSVEDVVQSYINLEKELGSKANEVGELRKLTDQILQQKVAQPQQEEEYINEIGFDDFIEDPSAAVNRAVENNPRLQALEASLQAQNQEKAHTALLENHSDADEVVASPEFQAWVQSSNGRMRNFQSAHTNLDYESASDLLDLYKQTRKVATGEAETERDARAASDLKKATVETGRTPADTAKIYRRSELIRLKMQDPGRYDDLSDDITLAYAEGRVK